MALKTSGGACFKALKESREWANAPITNEMSAHEMMTWALVLYYFVGLLYFCEIGGEHFSIGEGAYFPTATFVTAGYGDLVPANAAGRLITMFFALTGCTLVFMLLTEITPSIRYCTFTHAPIRR